jgi:hypothetical protein
MAWRRLVRGRKIPKTVSVTVGGKKRRLRVIKGRKTHRGRATDMTRKGKNRLSSKTRVIRLNRGDYFKVLDRPGGKVVGYL